MNSLRRAVCLPYRISSTYGSSIVLFPASMKTRSDLQVGSWSCVFGEKSFALEKLLLFAKRVLIESFTYGKFQGAPTAIRSAKGSVGLHRVTGTAYGGSPRSNITLGDVQVNHVGGTGFTVVKIGIDCSVRYPVATSTVEIPLQTSTARVVVDWITSTIALFKLGSYHQRRTLPKVPQLDNDIANKNLPDGLEGVSPPLSLSFSLSLSFPLSFPHTLAFALPHVLVRHTHAIGRTVKDVGTCLQRALVILKRHKVGIIESSVKQSRRSATRLLSHHREQPEQKVEGETYHGEGKCCRLLTLDQPTNTYKNRNLDFMRITACCIVLLCFAVMCEL